jgi:hypothetical protein
MFEITETTQKPESFSQEMHETVLKNRDILNEVFEKYKDSGVFPKISKIKGIFDRSRLPDFELLIKYGVLQEEPSQDGNKLILKFSGFLYCNHKDAKQYLRKMYEVFQTLSQYYQSRHEQFKIQFRQLCEDICHRMWREYEHHLKTIFIIMETSPLRILSVNWSTMHLELSECTVYEKIYDFKDADEYFEKCYKASTPQLGFSSSDEKEDEANGNKEVIGNTAFVPPSSKTIWHAIESEYKETKRGLGRKINFVTDAFKREILFRDIEQAYYLVNIGFSKSAVILIGGVIEELLRLYLEHKNIAPEKYDFNGYIKACEKERLLKSAIHKLSDFIRQFRNFVHLEKEITSRLTISIASSKIAFSSIFTIANDF